MEALKAREGSDRRRDTPAYFAAMYLLTADPDTAILPCPVMLVRIEFLMLPLLAPLALFHPALQEADNGFLHLLRGTVAMMRLGQRWV